MLANSKTGRPADLLDDRVLPYFEQHQLPMLRILTDRGTEYCDRMDQHDYQLYLVISDIDHTKTSIGTSRCNKLKLFRSQMAASIPQRQISSSFSHQCLVL